MKRAPHDLLKSIRESAAPTKLDRIIGQLAPGWAQKRLQARLSMAALGGTAWTGARKDLPELKNYNVLSDSPDNEQRYDRETLIARATDLERNDALAGGAINEQVLSVVGTGLSLQPEPARAILGWTQDQAVEWAETVKQQFQLWAQEPREVDLGRRRNFYQLQSLAYRAVCSRGDAFALLPRLKHPGGAWNLKIQVLEGDRCLNPKGIKEDEKTNQGVEFDIATGSPKRYHFCKKYPSGKLEESDFTAIDAFDPKGNRQVLHLYHETRPDLRRGYPLLAPVIATLKQMSRLSEAELAAAVVTSFFAVLIRKNGTGAGPLGGLVTQEGSQGFTELGPAIVADLQPGEDISNVAPNRPNGAFDPFWRSLLGQVAMRIQIPPEVLLKKFESSYTAARAALLQYWKFVSVERENLLAADFCQPIYEAWLFEAIAFGRVQAPGFLEDPLIRAAYCSARWIGDNAPILDPVKEVQAAQALIDYGLSTFSEQTMRLTGGDWEANHERLKREIKKRQDDGLIVDLMPESFGTPAQAPAPGKAPSAAPAETPDEDTDTEDADDTADQDEVQQ